MMDFLKIVFCACDEDMNGSLSHDELTTDVCKVILDHEVSEEHFDMVDANGDGDVTMEEVMEWAMANAHMAARAATYKDRMFSENGDLFFKQNWKRCWTLKRFFISLKLISKLLSALLDVFVMPTEA